MASASDNGVGLVDLTTSAARCRHPVWNLTEPLDTMGPVSELNQIEVQEFRWF